MTTETTTTKAGELPSVEEQKEYYKENPQSFEEWIERHERNKIALYRLVKETVDEEQRFYTEKRDEFGEWRYVTDSMTLDEEKGRSVFKQIAAETFKKREILDQQ